MATTIYHNPRCSKSRETLELVKEYESEPKIVEYLETPPSKTELNRILKMLGLEPRDLMRKKEPEYKQLKLDNPKLTRDQLIDAMIKNPKLIERPIVIKGNKAALGRPPERVLDILK